MKRCSFIRGNSKAIFQVSYSDVATAADFADINNYLGTIIEKMPKNSMLLLLDVRRFSLYGENYDRLKEMIERYSLYFGCSAVVADRNNDARLKNLIRGLGYSKMRVFDDPDAARESLFAGGCTETR